MTLNTWRFVTLMLASFSMSLNMAHLLEFPQRMGFDRDLWVRVTVFEGVYNYFGSVGAFFEIGAILSALVLAWLVRRDGSEFYLSFAGGLLMALAFASWLTFVAPANAEFARWLTHPIPPDWTAWRNQWEYTHAINAFIKIAGVSLLVVSVITRIGKPDFE